MTYNRRLRHNIQTIFFVFKDAYKHFCRDHIALAIGSISFFSFLSLVPLTLLAFTFTAQYFQSFIDSVHTTIGPTLYRSLEAQLEAVTEIRRISFILVFVFGFWSGGNIFINIESAMNVVWGAKSQRPLWRRRILAVVMICIFSLLLLISFLSVNFIRLISTTNFNLMPEISVLSTMIAIIITFIIPTVLVIMLFSAIYYMLPNVKLPLRYVFPGAIAAGIGWTVLLHLFSWFANYNFDRYQILYGSLTSIILLLLWLYYSSYIFMFGAELSAAVYRYKKHKRILKT